MTLGALRRLDFVADGIHHIAYMRAKTMASRPYSYNRLGAVFVATTGHPDQEVAKWRLEVRRTSQEAAMGIF